MTRISVEELLDEAEFEHLKNKKTSTGGCSKEAPASLTFVTMTENCKYSRQWNLSIITAPKITLRDYMKFMVRHSSKSFHVILIFNVLDSQVQQNQRLSPQHL